MSYIQDFPNVPAPLVDENRLVTSPWRYFFNALWQRTGASQGSSVNPPGLMGLWPTSTSPSGWLLCDGAEYSQSAFPALFAALGSVPSTPGNFRVPDLKNRFAVGAGGSYAGGATGGAAEVVLSQANMPIYTLPVTDPGHVHGITDPEHDHPTVDPANNVTAGAAAGGINATGGSTDTAPTGISVDTNTTGISVDSGGSNAPVPTLPPYYGVYFIIKT